MDSAALIAAARRGSGGISGAAPSPPSLLHARTLLRGGGGSVVLPARPRPLLLLPRPRARLAGPPRGIHSRTPFFFSPLLFPFLASIHLQLSFFFLSVLDFG